MQCGQLLVPLVDFFFPLPPLGIPLLPLHKRIGAPGHGEVALVGRAELDDFQLDAANTEAVAGAERGVGERLAIQSRVERPAANNGGLFAAENEAMDRSHPRARSRRVQRDPAPTLHLRERMRMSWPSRSVPRMRRTSWPTAVSNKEGAVVRDHIDCG